MTTLSYPVTRPVRTAEPTFVQEPVTLDEAKRQCSIPLAVGQHDERLKALIVAAREQVEIDSGLVCYTGTFTWKFTAFPHGDWFELPDIRPITAITSIAYVDTAGASQTWTSTEYALDTSNINPAVHLAYDESWPSFRGDINGIVVTFVAGYASVAAIPQRLKQAVLLQVQIMWDTDIGMDSTKLHESYERLLARLRRETYS